MTKKVLLDTNILVYGWDVSNPFNQLISEFFDKLKYFYITDRTLLEFYRVYTGPLKQSPKVTIEIINYFLNLPTCEIIYTNQSDLLLTFDLASLNQAKSGKIFDLNILATVIENDMEILCTKNVKDYPQTEFLEIVDPTL